MLAIDEIKEGNQAEELIFSRTCKNQHCPQCVQDRQANNWEIKLIWIDWLPLSLLHTSLQLPKWAAPQLLSKLFLYPFGTRDLTVFLNKFFQLSNAFSIRKLLLLQCEPTAQGIERRTWLFSHSFSLCTWGLLSGPCSGSSSPAFPCRSHFAQFSWFLLLSPVPSLIQPLCSWSIPRILPCSWSLTSANFFKGTVSEASLMFILFFYKKYSTCMPFLQ